jgi:hypothetical protein
MERIYRNNYESFFIDYLDGSLPIEEIDLLLDFLNENPDLAEELKELEKIILQPPNLSNFNYQHLKKTDLDLAEVFEETCIRAIENELSSNELRDFQEYLKQNEERQKMFELFQSTLSEPDPFIIYDQKNRLKKKTIVFKYWYAVAAIFILGLIFLLPPDRKQTIQSGDVQIAKSVEIQVPTPSEVKGGFNIKTIKKTDKNNFYIAKIEKVEDNNSSNARTREFIEPLKSLMSDIKIEQVFKENMQLASFEKHEFKTDNNRSDYLTVSELVTLKITETKEKGGIQKMVFNTLKKVSGKKFGYTTTNKGKVNKVEFNSQLFAFSIPVTSKN